jgi:crotonobetainyl-CoA:carnitine CoA-transferase CaiB-like acyl-CoA transferase
MFRFTDAMVPAYDKLGRVRERTGNVHQGAAPGNTFQLKDGRFIIMTISGNVLFRKLCQAMDRPEMADDPQYANHTLRWQHVQTLNDIVTRWMLDNEAGMVTSALARTGVPFSIVLTVPDIFEDAHYAARQNLATVEHPKLGPLRMQGIVPRMLGTPAEPIAPAHELGQDNEEVFQGLLGISREEYERLRQERVI